jgi:AcrR family transcriptional regulator
MDEVAREAGVGKATLYRYFPSKEELYLETLDQAFARLVERFSRVTSAEISADERLDQLVRTLFDTMVEQLPGLKLLGGDDSDLAERGRRLLRRRSRQIAAALHEVLEDGIRTGRFRPLDTEMTAALIIGMVRGGIMIAGDQPDGRLNRAVLDMVHAATRPAASSPGASQDRSFPGPHPADRAVDERPDAVPTRSSRQ